MPTISSSILRFRLIANVPLKSFTITDLIQTNYGSYGTLSDFKIMFKVIADNATIYANAGYETNDFSAPDMNGSKTPTWVSSAIDMVLDDDDNIKKVNYEIHYKVTDSVIVVETTQSKMWAYESPVVDNELSAKCSTSQLTSVDVSDYNVVIDGVSFSPTTLTRSHTITKPAGSGANAPGTTSAVTRVIGGGSTDATRLWTRVWQVNISTILAYNLEKWNNLSTEVVWFVVNDTVAGDNFLDVECDATICNLRVCYDNLLRRWMASLKSNFGFRESNRDLVIEASGLWTKLEWAERCGAETDHIIEQLKDCLKGEDCKCETNNEEATHVIVAWGSSTGGGGCVCTFNYGFHSVDPPSGGNDGDISENNGGGAEDGNLFKNIGGTWVYQGNVRGPAGAAGTNGTNSSGSNIIHACVTDAATVAGTGEVVLDSYTVPGGTLTNIGDILKLEAVFKLAANDNGKTMKLYFGGDQLISFFTDALQVDQSIRLTAMIHKVTTNSQKIEVYVEGEQVATLTATKDLSTSLQVNASAQNSVASAGDIILKTFTVYLFQVVLTLPTGIQNWDAGTKSLIADVMTVVTLNITMPLASYRVFAYAIDIDGIQQLVQIPTALKTVSNFQALTNVNTTLYWRIEL